MRKGQRVSFWTNNLAIRPSKRDEHFGGRSADWFLRWELGPNKCNGQLCFFLMWVMGQTASPGNTSTLPLPCKRANGESVPHEASIMSRWVDADGEWVWHRHRLSTTAMALTLTVQGVDLLTGVYEYAFGGWEELLGGGVLSYRVLLYRSR